MLNLFEITDIFYLCDEFSAELNRELPNHLLKADNRKKHCYKPNRLSDSEVMTILITFRLSQVRNLKAYYLGYVYRHLDAEFPQLVSYNRFVELQQKALQPLVLFLKTCRLGTYTGISFVDSITLDVCHIKREHANGVFDGIAAKGKSTMGRFFGFKLHLIINDKGEILSFVITRGNMDDRVPLEMDAHPNGHPSHLLRRHLRCFLTV